MLLPVPVTTSNDNRHMWPYPLHIYILSHEKQNGKEVGKEGGRGEEEGGEGGGGKGEAVVCILCNLNL